jgi:hypothetical protein
MDMGISGKKALVCASSKGLGRGCAEALAGEGVQLVINGGMPRFWPPQPLRLDLPMEFWSQKLPAM